MCFICTQCYRLLYCCMHMCTRLCTLSIFMLENIIHTGLMTCYNIMAALLQILSVIPLICVFMISSKISCVLCSSGCNACQKYPACSCYFIILIILIVLFYLKYLDPLLGLFGYVPIHKTLRKHMQVPERSPSLDDMDLKEALQMLDLNINETMASSESTQDVSDMKLANATIANATIANATIANATIANVIKLLNEAMPNDLKLMNATIASGVKLLNETISNDLARTMDLNDGELPQLDAWEDIEVVV